MTTVLLSTDEPMLAEGLTGLLSGREGLRLIAWCPGIDGLHDQLERHRPDALLVDLTAEVTFAVLSGLHEIACETRIVLWVHTVTAELALQATSLGVRGILRKTLPAETLLRCLRQVHKGEPWFEKALTDSLLMARRFSLTRREGQLIALLLQGLKNKEIATALRISEGAVKVYPSKLFQKLGAKDPFELALFGLRNLAPGASSLGDGSWGAPKTPVAPACSRRGRFSSNGRRRCGWTPVSVCRPADSDPDIRASRRTGKPARQPWYQNCWPIGIFEARRQSRYKG